MRFAPGFRFLSLFLGLALTLFLQPACLTNPSGPPTQEPTTITLSTYRIVFTAVDDYERVDATVLDQDSRVISDATVHWRSADGSIARVSDRGVVTASGNGTTQITVSSGYATATVTVSVEQAADSVEIMPPSITLVQVGATGQFTAVVYDANDRIIPGAVVVWSSSNPELVTVDANGLVTAVSPGDALITASSSGVSTSRPVYVEVAPEPSRIVLNISEATLAAVGQSLQLDAQVYDSDGAAIPGAAVMWSSSRPEVATVDAAGLVIAVSNGTTRVTASSGDASANALIHVVIEGTEPPDPPPEPEPPDPPPTDPPPPPPPLPPETSTDRDVLVALYNATDGPNWTNNTNWLSDAPLGDWYGVDVTANGQVINLRLNNNALSGHIPVELGEMAELRLLSVGFNALTGSIPVELGQLFNLHFLRLDHNELTGSIPPVLGKLTGLRTLDLVNNALTGRIPPELGHLANLRALSIARNQLTGSIPSELGALANLTELSAGANQLTGSIPPELGSLSKLSILELLQNGLTGNIPPELGRLTNLEWLYLNENQLTGEVPSEFGGLSSLGFFHLEDNTGLTGPLPASLTNVSLIEFSMGYTQLCVPSTDEFRVWLDSIENATGVTFCEPEPLSDRDALVALYHATDGPNWTNNTNWLSDKPIGDWYGVSTDADGRVTWLALELNRLNGVIPPEIGDLGNLVDLSLYANQLRGHIPPEIGLLSNLTFLNLGHNSLTGPIPAEIGLLSAIRELQIYETKLSGSIPSEIGQLSTLVELLLYGNELTGAIPPELGNLRVLETLHLGSNDLEGTIPSELGNLNSLKNLSLDSTQLTGTLPPELGNLVALERLSITNNQLSGGIPPEFGHLDKLESLQLQYNEHMVGRLPIELTAISTLSYLNLESTKLCVPDQSAFRAWLAGIEDASGITFCEDEPEPEPLSDRDILVALYHATDGPNWTNSTNWLSDKPLGEWHGVTTDIDGRVIYLGLHRNGLSGPLPPELGQLDQLQSLLFSVNGLTGSIPPEIGKLRNLVILSFHRNQLSGQIPPEIGMLSNLQNLGLGYNSLSGSIPGELTNLTALKEVSFNTNRLEGAIPRGIGNLRALVRLDFAHNQLTGEIPAGIGNLTALEMLWLGKNKLSGENTCWYQQSNDANRLIDS